MTNHSCSNDCFHSKKKSAWEAQWKTNKQEEQINLFLLNYKVIYTKPMYSENV